MGPLAIRRQIRRHRNRFAASLAVVACAAAVAAHHSGVGLGGDHHKAGTSPAVVMCLAAFTAVGAVAVAVLLGLVVQRGRRVRPPRVPLAVRWARSPEPRARAGPGVLLLLCVSRR